MLVKNVCWQEEGIPKIRREEMKEVMTNKRSTGGQSSTGRSNRDRFTTQFRLELLVCAQLCALASHTANQI